MIGLDSGNDGAGNGFAPDVFSMAFEYHLQDYQRSGTGIGSIQTGSTPANYAGLANGISWHVMQPASMGGVSQPIMNTYSYDHRYSLLQNNWGSPDFVNNTFNGVPGYQEKGLSYDAHGNIKTLQRTDQSGNLIADFQYNYLANSNKLSWVGGYASYTYDVVGQLSSETRGSQSKYLTYDVSGKVTGIYSDAAKTVPVVTFAYDENGARIMKRDHLQHVTTWYVDGNVYNGSQLIEQPIPSGIYYRQGGVYRYQLTDHVGSVRAIINRDKLWDGTVDVVYSADYYPFGTELAAVGMPSRYGYQGEYAEKDAETGYNNFYLRNYDPAIGRWLSVDPYGQYYSPYVGMGNDPVNRFDPDGGWSSDGGIWGWFKGVLGGEKTYTATNSSIEEVVITPRYKIRTEQQVMASQTYLRPPQANQFTSDSYRRMQYNYAQLQKNLNYNDLSHPLTSLAIGQNVANFAGSEAVLHKSINSLITYRLQSHVKKAVQIVDEAGDAAFTPPQFAAIIRNPNLRPMFRGNRIDVMARNFVKSDKMLNWMKSNYTKGADFVNPLTEEWWDITTPAQWYFHVRKYGEGGTLLRTR